MIYYKPILLEWAVKMHMRPLALRRALGDENYQFEI